MLYIFIKNIVESVITHYACPECGGKTSTEQIAITGMSSRGIDIHLVCSLCGIHSHVSAEINTVASELLANQGGQQFFSDFIKNGGTIGSTLAHKSSESNKSINDADIEKIGEDVANAKTIEDLMK